MRPRMRYLTISRVHVGTSNVRDHRHLSQRLFLRGASGFNG